jgi:predicted O-methyltransferase YrrM
LHRYRQSVRGLALSIAAWLGYVVRGLWETDEMIKDVAGRLGRALADPLTPARFARFVARAPAVLPVVELAAIRRISMIGEATLATLRATAALTRGAVLEIGPYMGGSTVALAGGLPRGVPLATIDVGGSYLGHATLPTDDILGALARNLQAHGVADRVTPIVGRAHDPALRAAVANWLDGRRIGLFFMDADTFPERNFLHFARYFDAHCIVVIDDYHVEDGSAKAGIVQAFVDRMVASGAVRPAGVVHCTWFGRVAGAVGLARLNAMRRRPHFVREQGFCWVGDPWLDVAADYLLLPDGSTAAGPVRLDASARAGFESAAVLPASGTARSIPASSLIVLEDGIPLLQAHALHDEIRQLGAGRYSHWTFRGGADRNGAAYREVLFSSSDNSDPNENGRRYTARAGDLEVPLGEV